ncbi:MAG TPA: molybdenum ABC transporter ATP-binding protein [Thermoanaerobaculia bacterium]|nr:molybdenum ABC transporter ATP-binding protein [Thermoanaerobaculia bacterium]
MSGLVAVVAHSRGAFRLRAELTCAPGEVVAVVGPSGAGKTTLLRCLAGLEPASGGRVEVGGETWQESARRLFVPPHRRRTGVVFQDGRLFDHLSVRGNLEYGWRRRQSGGGDTHPGASEREAMILATAADLGLTPLLDRPIDGLSGGERQRVALARALLASPALLLLDEPLAAIDPRGRAELAAALRTACRRLGVPVVLVTHARGDVLRLADRVSVLQAGEVTASGPLASMTSALAAVPPEPGEDLAAVIEARVARHDDADLLTYLDFPGGTFAVPRLDALPGATHRVLVQARDVSLTLSRPIASSILNVYPARVEAIDEGDDGLPVVRLLVGDTPLLARISRRSRRELALAPGMEVFAQVKAVALG